MRTLSCVLLLSSLCVVIIHANDPQPALFVYGSPYQSEDTGFATMSSIDKGWKPYASGFPTSFALDSEYNGIRPNYYNSDALLFGEFQFWGSSYVGGILHVNPATLEVSAIGKGVSGPKVSDATYIYGYSDGQYQEYIIVLGSFWSFQQNPSSAIINVGICFDGGKNCYQLGQGLPEYKDLGQLLVVNQYIYALYVASDNTCRIDMYEFDNGNFSSLWQNIYSGPSYFSACRQSLATTVDASGAYNMLLLGNHNDTAELNGMAIYQPNVGWSPYGPFPFPQKTYFVQQVFSDVIFVLQGYSFYRWDGSTWTNVWNGTQCYTSSLVNFHLLDEWSFFAPCNNSFAYVYLDQNLTVVEVSYYQYPEAYSCDVDYTESYYDPDTQEFLAVCVGSTNITYIDKYAMGGKPDLVIHKNIGTVSVLTQDVTSFCTFGNGKMFISGYFDSIGDSFVSAAAVWDGVRWNRLDPSLGLTKDYGNCYCASENDQKNSMIVVGCSVFSDATQGYSSFLLFSYESLSNPDLYDPTHSSSDTDIYPFSVVFQDQTDIIWGVSLQSSIAYVAWNNDYNGSISRWSWGFEETLVQYEGFVSQVIPFGNILYASGLFGVDDQGFAKTLFRYNVTSQQYLPVDNVWNTKSPLDAVTVFTQDVKDNSTIYVAGYFNEAGSLSYARNIALLNTSSGLFIDNLNGGAPGLCADGTSINNILYLVYQQEGCSGIPQCLVLTSYNPQDELWTFTLRSGVFRLSQGYPYNPNLKRSSGLTWWMIMILGLGCIAASVLLFIGALAGYRIAKKRQMKRLHDGFSHIAYHPLVDDIQVNGSSSGYSSYSSAKEVDFQNEDIRLKNVLGKGSFGTVWSCVLPERKGATYAVKQVLISAGELDKVAAVEKEIQILQQLRHKNIVHFAGYKKDQSKSSVEFFLFMELFEKPCSLRGMIEKRLKKSGGSAFFTYAEVKSFLEQILAGMQYLHHHGIAHRDLKCANILVRAHDITVTSLHIADFGLSKTFLDAAGSKVLASTVTGTPTFMAPEVLKGVKYDPFKADVWSFGIVIFEILTLLEPKELGVRPKFPTSFQFPCLNDDTFQPILHMFEQCTEVNPTMRPTVDTLVATLEDL